MSGRPDNRAFNILAGGKVGIIWSEGQHWLEQRQFTLRKLRDFGFGKKSLESTILEEVGAMVGWLKEAQGQALRVDQRFSCCTLNTLWYIVTGERYEHDDPQLLQIIENSRKISEEAAGSGVPIFFPQLAEWFPKLTGFQTLVNNASIYRNMFADALEKHELHPAPEGQPRDLIDVYLAQIRATTDPRSSFYGASGAKALLAVIGDLYTAGIETTSQTLTWAVLYLIRFPAIQRQLHAELDLVIASDRVPSLSDRPNLPYTEAFIMETMRFSSLVPMSVFHQTMSNVSFHGYEIPKGTMVISNIYSAHFDAGTWGDPRTFRPERFLSPDGRTVLRNEALVPFSAGKRVCLGETLARDQIFLFLTNILRHFDLCPDPTAPEPSLESRIGFLQTAHKFTLVAKDRLT